MASAVRKLLTVEDETRYLLQFQPDEAIIRMFNVVNGVNYPIDYFTISAPTVVEDTLTRVTLTRRPSASANDRLGTLKSYTFTYHRVDVATYLGAMLKGWHPELPTTTQAVLNKVTDTTGQTFTRDDFVLEFINEDNAKPYTLKAKAESLRWCNQAAIAIAEDVDVGKLFAEAGTVTVPVETPITYPFELTFPFVNASGYQTLVDELTVGDLAQDNPAMVNLFNALLKDPRIRNPVSNPWYVSDTPGVCNLYNTKVEVLEGEGVSSALTGVVSQSSIRFVIDGSYCLGFRTPAGNDNIHVVFPYGGGTLTDFSLVPRLTQSTSVSRSDGSAYSDYLASLKVGDVITHAEHTPPDNFLIDGLGAWGAWENGHSAHNLEGAQVVYNGDTRVEDGLAKVQGLDQELVVELSAKNGLWGGTYRFYYSAAFVMPVREITTPLNRTPHVDFTPTLGHSPFTYAISDPEHLPPGVALDGPHFTGTATAKGSYTYQLAITDAVGNTLAFAITHTVVDAVDDLAITGTLPNSQQGANYLAVLTASGGMLPYQDPVIKNGFVPSSVAVTMNGSQITFDGVWRSPGEQAFTLELTSADGQAVEKTCTLNVQPVNLVDLQIRGNFADGIVGQSYHSVLEIIGGAKPYFEFEYTGVTSIPGMTFSLVDDQIILSGTPTEENSYALTVKVRSADSQTALLNVNFVFYKVD